MRAVYYRHTALDAVRSSLLSAKWFTLLRWALRIDWRQRVSNEWLLQSTQLMHRLHVVKERHLGFLGHSLRKHHRKLSQGVSHLTPLSTVLMWDGESTRRFTASQAAIPTRLVKRVGQGNRMTLLRYTARFLDLPPVIATPAHLQD